MREEKAALEKEFLSKRVRRVHHRKQAVKVLKAYDNGMCKELAWCCDTDVPVECFKIPKVFHHFEELTQFYNQIGATKELLLSKYMPSYLGFDDLSDSDHNQYFFEIKKGRNVKKIL